MYFAVSMVLVCMSLILAVIVLNVHHRGDIPGKKVPKWIRKCCLEGLGACFRSRGKHTLDKPRQTVTSTGEIPNGQLPLKEVGHHFFSYSPVRRLTVINWQRSDRVVLVFLQGDIIRGILLGTVPLNLVYELQYTVIYAFSKQGEHTQATHCLSH